jgi:hypothetical protein
MISIVENYSTRKIFLVLATIFLIFYTIQIPFWTSNPDVIIYSSKASEDKPILKYAFLDEHSLCLSDTKPLPNYHLGHNLILWLIYRILPDSISDNSIWPAGLVSAISGAFFVGLTFLLAMQLKIQKKTTIIISIFAGLIPSIWYHNLIGEVYALQLTLIILFILLFLKNKWVLSSLAFLFSNLVSPLSGLSFTFLLLAPKTKENFIKAFLVGFCALSAYIIIIFLLDLNIFDIFNLNLQPNPSRQRSFLWVVFRFCSTIALNFGLLLYYFFYGCISAKEENRRILIALFLAVIPQIVLALSKENFLVELGSFQLILFWAMCFPIGFMISNGVKSKVYFSCSLCGIFLVFIFVWWLPNTQIGKEQYNAGIWLKSNIAEENKIIGPWNCTIGVASARYRGDFNKISNKYINKAEPETDDIEKLGQKSLIIVAKKYGKIRVLLNRLPVIALKIDNYNPIESIQVGSVKHLFENRAVSIFRWDSAP